MWDPIIYLQCGGRKPVATYRYIPGQDPQARMPVGWCVRCGAEVYRVGAACCRRCIRFKEERDNDHD